MTTTSLATDERPDLQVVPEGRLLRLGKSISNPKVVVPFSVIASLTIFFLIHYLLGKTPDMTGIILAAVTPFAIAVPMTSLIHKFITHIEHQNHAISEQKKQLEQLNQIKSTLFSVISHDLRSPLASLKGVLDAVNGADLSQEEFKYYTGRLGGEFQSTFDMLDNLLRWSRAQLSGIRLDRHNMLLQDAVDTVIRLLNPIAARKGIQMQSNGGEESIVYADSDIVMLVLRNLLSNAIKFTPSDGVIKIDVIERGDLIEVHIIDNGVGISLEDQGKLFQLSSHHSTTGTQGEKGSGLGLVLCREFVEKHGGRIWVTSMPGQGCDVAFTLPAAQ